MSLTVADCLKLPSLRNCTVVAGKSGLSHVVNNASVLEVFDNTVFENSLVVNNGDMLLTSFAAIKDNYELQCDNIRKLYETGDAALVIYYVGIYLKEIHPSLIETADRLGLPLLVMPENRQDCFYDEVLGEVYEALFRERNRTRDFMDNIISQVSRLPENRRNIATLLRLISDSLKCTVLLSDTSMNNVSISKWPFANSITADEICALHENSSRQEEYLVTTTYNGMPINIFCVPFTAFEYRNFSVYVADDFFTLTLDDVYKIVEILQLFSKLWDLDTENILHNALVPAILEGDEEKMYQISAKLGININAINALMIFRPNFGQVDLKDQHHIMRNMIKEIKSYSKAMNKEIIVDTYGLYIVCFFVYSTSRITDNEYLCALTESMKQIYNNYTLSFFPNDDNVEDVQKTYRLYTENISYAAKIFPHKKQFSYGDILFAKQCYDMLTNKDENYRICQNILKPLLENNDNLLLLETLSVYHLDADCEIKKTSEMLYVHRNTVQYRLGRVRDITNFRSEDKLQSHLMYLAIAAYRLEKSLTPVI